MAPPRRRDGDGPRPQPAPPGRRAGPDACPGAWRRHEAADGALARFRPVGGAVAADELRTLVGAAAMGGSPLEITSRGSVQVRGLSARRADDLADALRSDRHDALLDTSGRDVPCGLLASPRSGHLDAAAGTVAAALRGRAGVPGRLLIALDDGTGDVSGQDADVAVVGLGSTSALLLAGIDTGIRADDPAALALTAVDAFLAVRGEAWRVAEVGVAPVLAATGWSAPLSGADQPVGAAERPQRPDLGRGEDGVLEVLPRLGELTPRLGGVLVALMDAGAVLRVTPWRTLVLRSVPDTALESLAGLVETGPSRWTGLSACVGAPRCAKSHTDVRADLADAVATGRAGGIVRAHWVGCHRACGTPGGQVAVVEGTPSGGYRTVVRAGRVDT